MRVLVTGASGFIGSRLCSVLVGAGHEVSALVRRPGSEPPGTRPFAGELSDGERLRSVLGQTRPEAVLHLAAEIASQRSEARVREVNVAGTGRLVAACLALAPEREPALGPRLVLASTVVTGDAHGALLTEEGELPVSTPYGRSKRECERMVRASGLPAVIVRPSHVYGPGGWYAQELIPPLRRPGRFAVIGRGENLWDVVHVDDTVAAFQLALERSDPGRTYHVVDDEPITFYDFMALTSRALGVGPPRRVPAALARLVAGRNAVDAVTRSARSSNARIRAELGWRPRFASAREGIPDALARLGGAA